MYCTALNKFNLLGSAKARIEIECTPPKIKRSNGHFDNLQKNSEKSTTNDAMLKSPLLVTSMRDIANSVDGAFRKKLFRANGLDTSVFRKSGFSICKCHTPL